MQRNAIKIKAFGTVFDSKGEYERYLFLLSEEKRGSICKLSRQNTMIVDIYGEKLFSYTFDFAYFKDNELWLEEYKGYKTPVWRLKWKILQHKYKHNGQIKLFLSDVTTKAFEPIQKKKRKKKK